MTLESKAQKYEIIKEAGNSCDFYKVTDPVKEKDWTVIHNLTKNTWSCDCLWFSLKQTKCSHIRKAEIYEGI